MTRRLTVGELREALDGIDDAVEVFVAEPGAYVPQAAFDLVDVEQSGAAVRINVQIPSDYWGDC